MVDLIGDIVDFFIKSVLFKIIGYFLFLAFILAIFIELAFFKATGHIDFTIFFNKEILGELAFYYKKEIALLGIAITLFYMSLALYLQNKIAKRKNCAIQEVELKQIAKLWLENESYKEIIKQEIIESHNSNPKEEKQAAFIIPSFKNPRSYSLFEYINSNKEAFSLEGVEIISDLIKIIESNPTSSVASKFKEDPNYKDYKKLVIANKTSYDILSEVNLYTHTFNVIDKSIKYIEEKFKKEKTIYLQRAIIAALAHDIGKIQVPLTEAVTYDLFKKAPHNVISALILREKYPELEKDVIEAVEQHHGAIKNKNNFILKILLEADKKAREEEIKQWLINNKKLEDKEENKDKENENENKNINDKNKNEENEDNLTQQDIKDEVKEIEEEKEDEEALAIDIEDLFSDEDESDYEGDKEIIKKEIEDKLCNLKKGGYGLDLAELVFVKENKIYISLIYLKSILNNKEKEFIDRLKETKEGYVKQLKIRAFNKDYKLVLVIINDEALGLDVSNINCDEVEIEEEE